MSQIRVTAHVIAVLALLVASRAVPADEPMLPVSYDADDGRVLLEIRRLDEPLIYANTLATGLGATSPLLDRAGTGDSALVVFERHGERVLLIRENPGFRALTRDAALRESVRESFPRSVLAALPIVEERAGRLTVDATDFFLQDVFGVGAALKKAELGEPSLDAERSYIVAGRTAAFARNTEVRAALTIAVNDPEEVITRHAPDGRSLTFEQQHSFLALPEQGYRPREFHPRSGVFPHVFFDFARRLEDGYHRRWIWRWRLEPSDPEAYLAGEPVEPVEPIVFHLDPAIPEPYREAFRQGGMWWAEAFEAAGFKNAFQIRDLPEGADPLDIRYPMLMWVHRSERGPSIGPHYRDPRSGEIVSAKVRMDSYRSLVNHDLWMGFLPAAGPDGPALDSEQLAMARRRQHAAHEVGHSLGMAHNFLAATRERASVMDYPVPLVDLDEDGNLELSGAYAEGIGERDKLAVRYAYTWFPNADAEREGLAAILAEAAERDLPFITGNHAADTGSYPDATRWVEGSDMLAALERTLRVRRVLIERFDERALADDEPYVELNRRFAHVYLHHRTALIGTVKHLGGMEFSYALKRDGLDTAAAIPPETQRRALEAALAALHPAELRIPDSVSALMAPAPIGWDRGWGWDVDLTAIESPSGPVFDPVHTAHRLAAEIVGHLLEPARMARLASWHARDPDYPGADEVIEALLAASWNRAPERGGDAHDAALHRIVQRSVLDGLLDLGGSESTVFPVRAAAEAHLAGLAEILERATRRTRAGTADYAHRRAALADIRRYFEGEDDPARRPRPEPIQLPWP